MDTLEQRTPRVAAIDREKCASMHPDLRADVAQQIGKRVKFLREQQGWTIRELAQRAELSESNLGRLERGLQLPGMENALDLAAALGLRSVDELFGPLPPSGEVLDRLRPSA